MDARTIPAPFCRRRRGLTFLEVMVAASILSIAALAVLELLSSSDRVGLTARRQALAAVEAERALEACAQALKAGRPMPQIDTLQTGMTGEALGGCALTVTSTSRAEEFVIPPPGSSGAPRSVIVNIRLLVAAVETREGERLVEIERAVPVD